MNALQMCCGRTNIIHTYMYQVTVRMYINNVTNNVIIDYEYNLAIFAIFIVY